MQMFSPEDLHVNPASAPPPPSEHILSRIPFPCGFAAHANQRPAMFSLRASGSVPGLATRNDSFGRQAVIRTTGTFGDEFAGAASTWR